ncbi:hypothetical protein AB1Y20_018164 [Prymnesium parvum]|uniref:HotDog ACOT-type domain-containing protein n=1 Tax=Prymnesium parvum TaxID=97485 RepID=A0AB34JPW2_PRYPA
MRPALSVRRLHASSGRLIRPVDARIGTSADVHLVLPITAELSAGARKGIPAWLEAAPRGSREATWLELTYPMKRDPALRQLYSLADSTSLRAGMFMEEIDAFSADCALRHALGPDGHLCAEPKLTIVTAAHDNLSFLQALSAENDLRLRGCVVAVGSSSIEVRTDVLIACLTNNREKLLGTCYTVMVARDSAKPDAPAKVKVHPLLPVGADRNSVSRCSSGPAVFDDAAAQHRQRRRKLMGEEALSRRPPTASEVPLMHDLWRTRAQVGVDPSRRRIPILHTEQRAIDVMQPQHRNQNGFMFGGYLMRRALEVGWLAAYRCCRHPPQFAGVDDVLFRKPVRVGCLLEYIGRVVYASSDGALRVYVEAHALDLRTGERDQTNEFHLVFNTKEDVLEEAALVDTPLKDGEDIAIETTQHGHPGMQPNTYEEAMLYLEGRRRWLSSFGYASDTPLAAKM